MPTINELVDDQRVKTAHQLLIEKTYRKPLRSVLIDTIRKEGSLRKARLAINNRTGLTLVRNTYQVWMRGYGLTATGITHSHYDA